MPDDACNCARYTLDKAPVTLDELFVPENDDAFEPGEQDAIRAMQVGDVRTVGAGGAFATFELRRVA